MPNFFHLVPQVVEETKYFDVSRDEIERELVRTGEYAMESVVPMRDADEEISVTVELRMSWKNGNGTLALLLHKMRIDGIDYERAYTDIDGNRRSGWHRHVWNAGRMEAKTGKVAVEDLDDDLTVTDFLIRTLSIMGIVLNAVDHGNQHLPFD